MKARRAGRLTRWPRRCADEHPPATAATVRCRAGPMSPARPPKAEADHDNAGQANGCWCRREFRDFVPARHPALRYAIALNDGGYFWESQEVLEAVWAAAPQGGRERILLRACIQIANANLRLRMQQAARGGAAVAARRWRELNSARRAQGGRRRATDSPTASRPRRSAALLESQTGAAVAVQGRLGGDRAVGRI